MYWAVPRQVQGVAKMTAGCYKRTASRDSTGPKGTSFSVVLSACTWYKHQRWCNMLQIGASFDIIGESEGGEYRNG